MPQSLVKNYMHITFSTKNRHPFIDKGIKEELFSYLGGICKNLECNPIIVGGHKDHVHILCLLSRKIAFILLFAVSNTIFLENCATTIKAFFLFMTFDLHKGNNSTGYRSL